MKLRIEWRDVHASNNWNVSWVMTLCFQGEWVVLPHSKCRSEVPRTLILEQLTPRTLVKIPTSHQIRTGQWEILLQVPDERNSLWPCSPPLMGFNRRPEPLPAHQLSDLVEWRAQRAHSSVSLQRAGNKDHHQISPNCYKNRLWGRQLSIVSASVLLLFHYWTSFNRLPKWNTTWNCLMPAINNS